MDYFSHGVHPEFVGTALPSNRSVDLHSLGRRSTTPPEAAPVATALGNEEEPGRAGEDDDREDAVYLTDHHVEWECHYLKRIAKRIHRLVCAELDRSEEALFMLFAKHDSNLNGVVQGEEVKQLLDTMDNSVPGAGSSDSSRSLIGEDGSISLVSLLRWYSGEAGHQYKDTTAGFNFTSLTVGFLGSGALENDSRVDALDLSGLHRSVVGYRSVLQQVRQLQEERALLAARELERAKGAEAALPAYHNVLAKEFDGDADHLFEIFCQVDESNNMLLEEKEVEQLLRLLDPDASDEEVTRYITEINLSEGPLTFASLVDWWDQACKVENSLISEKGAAFIAGMKASFAKERLSALFSETAVQRRWAQAKKSDRLTELGEAYCRTYAELRAFKMDRDLRNLEQECAKL